MTREIKLTVNDKPIQIDYFVAGFIDHTVTGMLAGLEGTAEGKIKSAEINIDGAAVAVNVDNSPLPINAFVIKIIGSTLKGLLSTLKGVDSQINTVALQIKK